ncbi:unnamed protein product [Cylicocyclus nassatus]|uniref:Regulatory protein zeste n=1 Tax=Cylicocyclus nassatus TaxID=53992 RepID=A0AA36MAY9_CYLNA|nr:unnamed protein product [Cylicocyclus nassatus]
MKNPTRMPVNLRKKSISSDSWQEMNDLRVVIRYDTLATVSVTKLGNLPDKARLARLDAFVEEVISLPGVWYVVSVHYFIRDLCEFEKEMSKVEVDIAERPVKDTSEGNVALLKGLAMFLEWPDYEFRREYVRYKKSIMYHPKVSRDMLLKSWRALLGRRAPRLDITIYFDDGIYLVFIENVPTYTPQTKFDHTEVIAEEVMKRRDILWDNANNRLPNLNARRSAAWKQVRNAVFTKCDRDMTIEQIKRCWRAKKGFIRDLLMKEKSYRTGTGGGVDMELERAIAKGMALMSENDVQIARSLGREASFCGLRSAESAAEEPPPSRQQQHADEPTSARHPEISKDFEPSPTELYQELSMFESETDDDESAPPRKKSRSNQHQFLEEQRELLRFQKLLLEKEYALCSKVDALLEKVNLKLEVICGRGHELIYDDSFDKSRDDESDDGVTHICSVYQGYALQHSTRRLDIAGKEIIRHFIKCSCDCELPMHRNNAVLCLCLCLPITSWRKRFEAPEVLFQPHFIIPKKQESSETLFGCIQSSAIVNRLTRLRQAYVSGSPN